MTGGWGESSAVSPEGVPGVTLARGAPVNGEQASGSRQPG